MTLPLRNSPKLWQGSFPRPPNDAHKYDRGHALILGAPELTGATRLAAGACSRIGAGLVSVTGGARSDLYRAILASDIMVRESAEAVKRNIDVILGGPGGIGPEDRNFLYNNPLGAHRVIDADAIPGPTDRGILDHTCILTPHDGEFKRAFPEIDGDRSNCARMAAGASGAIIVYKGAMTIIADTDGRMVVHDAPNPYLAKAGTGDVLAGLITGLVAQSMPCFDAACAAVWIHSEAGKRIGAGLVASDIESEIRAVLRELLRSD